MGNLQGKYARRRRATCNKQSQVCNTNVPSITYPASPAGYSAKRDHFGSTPVAKSPTHQLVNGFQCKATTKAVTFTCKNKCACRGQSYRNYAFHSKLTSGFSQPGCWRWFTKSVELKLVGDVAAKMDANMGPAMTRIACCSKNSVSMPTGHALNKCRLLKDEQLPGVSSVAMVNQGKCQWC
jgi:hypothetical protein